MLESVEVKVCAQAPVQNRQHVLVERRCYPVWVVVGEDESIVVFDQVGAEQEPVARCHGGHDVAQQFLALARGKVSDGAAQQCDQAGAAAGDLVEVMFEVADYSVDVHVWIASDQRFGAGSQDAIADIERDESLELPSGFEGIEERRGLVRSARAKLDEGVGC